MSQKNPKSASRKPKRGQKQRRNLWPLWFALGGVALVVLAIAALGRGSPPPEATIEVSGAPSLKVDQEKVDLGDRKLGVPVKVSFELRNVGDRPLRFTQQPYVEIKEGC